MTPRAVRKEYFDQICPNKTIIRADVIRKLHEEWAPAPKIMETWVNYIRKIDDPCLEVERDSGNIFHILCVFFLLFAFLGSLTGRSMFGHPQEVLPIWPTLSKSPMVQLFGWGTLAHSAFEANRHLFSPAPLIQDYITSPACLNCVDPYAPLDGLLALHLRRGDFLEHCTNLANWNAGFQAFATFPEFLDPWAPPQGSSKQKLAVYLRRCLPTIEQIVEKVVAVRESRAGRGLKNIYIMTNGDQKWLGELKAALRASWPGWELIASSRDMTLTPEQKYVSQTIDMLIGQRAQAVIGNGVSNIVGSTSNARHSLSFITVLKYVFEHCNVPPSKTNAAG